jgi:hypothetical protein
MSEEKARKYTSIHMLRDEIRRDMEDYKLLYSDNHEGSYHFSHSGNLGWFSRYLKSQINNNLSKLKQLVEQNNE